MPSYEKVFVTGGAGLIGSHIVDLLVEGQADGTYGDVVVFDDLTRGRLDNLAGATSSGKVEVVEGDIRDVDALASAIDGSDLVFHLAAIRITHCAEDPRLAMEVLGNGTFNVVDAAHRVGAEKVVASSSASVYGMAEDFPTTEQHHPYGNRTLYGAIKTFNEGLLRSYHDMFGLDYVALRYFNVYGPRMDVYGKYTEVLIRWMERIIAGEAPIIFGDGTQTMDFVYATDIARANVLAAQADVTDDVFNVASGTETSLDELAAALCVAMDSDLAPEYGPERSVNPVPRRLADTSRARDVLGFEAKIGLDEGLRDLVDWWSSVRADRPEAMSS
ncbi:NAD-dependent epimerase/dehydratase family protein [Ilumatobacter sp.]|uniref:NAD-dependent epimerase/dehydratase family protein n=1 Tax=Ilumatobacter sp. TaxID=1967498 RepID=UPI003AF95269